MRTDVTLVALGHGGVTHAGGTVTAAGRKEVEREFTGAQRAPAPDSSRGVQRSLYGAASILTADPLSLVARQPVPPRRPGYPNVCLTRVELFVSRELVCMVSSF